MTQINQVMTAATAAGTDNSSVLIPFNAPTSASFDQVLQSISMPSGGTGASSPGTAAGDTSTGMSGGASTASGGSSASTQSAALPSPFTLSPSPSSATGASPLSSATMPSPLAPNPAMGQMGQMGQVAQGDCGGGCCCCCCGRSSAMASTAMDSTGVAMGTMVSPSATSMGTMGMTESPATSMGAIGTMAAPSTSGALDGQVQGAAQQVGTSLQNAASAATTTGFAMPFQGSAPITQPFGPTPYLAEPAYDGYSHFHTGIDYALPLGTPVSAAAGGTVVSAGWDNTGFGNCVIIDHGNGLRTLYGHLEKITVQAGDKITPGQELGLSGSTGNSSGPHLHFGVQKDGQWVDPAPYLAGTVAIPAADASASNPAPTPASSDAATAGTAPTTGGIAAAGSAASGTAPTTGSAAASNVVTAGTVPTAANIPAAANVTTAGIAATGAVPSGAPAGQQIGGGSPTPVGDTSADSASSVSSLNLPRTIKRVAAATGVPGSLIAAVVQAESNGNPQAVSPVGAKGLMQLMDATAASYGVTNSFDPLQNVMGGASYLRNLLQRYNGDVALAVAAYNAGPAAVDRYGGIPPYPETQQYVQRVTGLWKSYDAPGAYQ